MTQVWCGIPVFNNAATIVDVVRRCRKQIDNVIVVDDGSTDADLRELLKTSDVNVVRHPANRGKGTALLTALNFAAERGAEFLITLDGDGQHFPEDLAKFIGRLSPGAILLGSRDEIVGTMPRSSLFGREFSDFWICVETGVNVVDSQSGYRAYPIKPILELPLGSKHYNFEVEVLTRALWAALIVQDVPIRVWYPVKAERVSSFDPVRDNARISLLHTRLVLRQLLPFPHRKRIDRPQAKVKPSNRFGHLVQQNSSALGLTAAAIVAIPFSIVLWPWGAVPILYIAYRLHLNILATLAFVLLCLFPAIPAICLRIGQSALHSDSQPRLAWVVGSHLVALILTPIVAFSVYAARRAYGAVRQSDCRKRA